MSTRITALSCANFPKSILPNPASNKPALSACAEYYLSTSVAATPRTGNAALSHNVPRSTYMSVTTVQVHLPAYSHSFNVSVPSESTVQDFKHAISRACIGEPQVSGQRVIFRGRVLEDSENVSEVWKVSSPGNYSGCFRVFKILCN